MQDLRTHRSLRCAVFAASLLCLLSRGDHFGNYDVLDARLVDAIPCAAMDGAASRPGSEYIEVDLTSRTSLQSKQTGAGLYVLADFCPFEDEWDVIAFGPTDRSGQPVENWRRINPMQSDRRGRYQYRIYLAPSAPERQSVRHGAPPHPAYDLRRDQRDVCVRFFVPGYNIIASRSNTIRIPATLIAAALRSGSN